MSFDGRRPELGAYWWKVQALLISLSAAYLLTPVLGGIAKRSGVMDYPARRKVHDAPTPLFGGIALFLGVLLACGTAIPVSEAADVWELVAASAIMLVLGAVDDARGLSAKVRLLAQIGVTCVLMWRGTVLKLVPGGGVAQSINVALTLLWVVGITNALNFFDGLDGLAGGLTIITGSFLAIVAFQSDQIGLGLLGVSVAGAAAGFMPHNFRPKRSAAIFLGDAGSMFLGYLLATFSVRVQWSAIVAHPSGSLRSPFVSFTVPVLIFGVLIFDMIHITVARFATGRVRTFREWLDYVGKDHLHHRFESLLRSKRGSVFMIYLLSVCLGITGAVLRNARKVDAIVLLAQAVFIFAIVTILEFEGNRRNRRRDY